MRTIFILLALGLFASAQTGGPWTIAPSTLDGGGTISTAGVWKVTGTIGQADAAEQGSTGGNWAVRGGFWPGTVEASDGPALRITPLGATEMNLAWTYEAIGYQLQYSTDLWFWTDYPGLTIGGASNVVWPLRNGPRYFFRLRPL